MDYELSKEVAARKGIIEGTVRVLRVADANWFIPTPSNKAAVISYRFGACQEYPDGIPFNEDIVPLECFEGHDPTGYLAGYLARLDATAKRLAQQNGGE